jgi:hypothetical protein
VENKAPVYNQTQNLWPGSDGSLNADNGAKPNTGNNLIPQTEHSIPQYKHNNEKQQPGSAANAVPANSNDSIYDGNGNSSPSTDNNLSDNSPLKKGEQNLDDYVLNQHPVTGIPTDLASGSGSVSAPVSRSGNRENAAYSGDSGSGDFLPSTVAYPESPYGPFDPLNQDINHYEYVAKEFVSSQPTGLSDNPMDPNWGGVKYTQDVIKSGKYNDNNITRPLLFQPKGIYIDAVPSAFGKPQDVLN